MSKLIASLLDVDNRSFSHTIYRLEHMAMQSGTDVQLTAEIITQTREKVRSLGLDPADTPAEEFYYSLLSKAADDSEILRERLDIQKNSSQSDAASKIALATEKLLKKDLVVSMQSSAVRKILKAVPPKKTMKALHFRSIDSVLKREDPLHFYALANKMEDKSWHSQVHARLKRLQPRDAKEAPVQVLSLPQEWLEKLTKLPFESVAQTVPEIGAVLILPSMPIGVKGSILLTVSLVLQAGQKLAIESLPYRAKALTVGIEKLLPDIAAGIVEEIPAVQGLRPSWHAVYRLLSEQSRHLIPDFEFVLNDLEWESTETRLSALDHALDFWVNSHYLAYPTEPLPVSLHVVDVAASLVLGKDFNYQVVSHMRSSLWNELQVRYLKHETLERQVLTQLSMSQEVIL